MLGRATRQDFLGEHEDVPVEEEELRDKTSGTPRRSIAMQTLVIPVVQMSTRAAETVSAKRSMIDT